jgi:hypothetical protein
VDGCGCVGIARTDQLAEATAVAGAEPILPIIVAAEARRRWRHGPQAGASRPAAFRRCACAGPAWTAKLLPSVRSLQRN